MKLPTFKNISFIIITGLLVWTLSDLYLYFVKGFEFNIWIIYAIAFYGSMILIIIVSERILKRKRRKAHLAKFKDFVKENNKKHPNNKCLRHIKERRLN